jgi:pleiotropic regulator 1
MQELQASECVSDGPCAVFHPRSGSRLASAEADKTVKMWREDEDATPETHPINFRPPRDIKRF